MSQTQRNATTPADELSTIFQGILDLSAKLKNEAEATQRKSLQGTSSEKQLESAIDILNGNTHVMNDAGEKISQEIRKAESIIEGLKTAEAHSEGPSETTL